MIKWTTPIGYSLIALGLWIHTVAYAAPTIEPLELRKDKREPLFARVVYPYYQNKPYEALTTLLGSDTLSFNASGTVNIMLGDLYSRYGLTREADAALSRTLNSDVTANNRNEPWLNYGKLLYTTEQDNLAVNFLSKPPKLLTPTQESERVIMLANLLLRTDRYDEALNLLKNFDTPSAYFNTLARYNYALALLRKTPEELRTENLQKANSNKTPQSLISKARVPNALSILLDLQQGKITALNDKPSTVKQRFSMFSRSDERKESTSSAQIAPQEDSSISETDVQNLKDKIALSIAYLQLQQKDAQAAKNALRNVRLDSPYSNTALLTNAHAFFESKDYKKAFNFAAELGKRNGADPLVQESWLIAARCLEEMKSPNAQSYYDNVIDLLKSQYAQLNRINKLLETIDIVNEFPIVNYDPILITLPDIRNNELAGIWAYLLDQQEILRPIQQVRQTHLLRSQLATYQTRIDHLKSAKNLNADQEKELQQVMKILFRLETSFDQAMSNDQRVLLERAIDPLARRKERVDFYLTEAILGRERVSLQSKE